MPYHKHWVEKLEAHYKENADTLIPRLLTFYGAMAPLAEEADVSISVLSRWCEAHGIERRLIYVKRDKQAT